LRGREFERERESLKEREREREREREGEKKREIEIEIEIENERCAMNNNFDKTPNPWEHDLIKKLLDNGCSHECSVVC
jgi:hypothetical protein